MNFIDYFYSILKRKVYEKSCKAENILNVINQIRYWLKENVLRLVQKFVHQKIIDFIRWTGALQHS